jgi:HK97 family phage prohead protease
LAPQSLPGGCGAFTFMDPLQHKECLDGEFKILDDSPHGSFTGYASVFGNTDRQNEVVVKGAFASTLPAFLKDGFGALNHEWSTLPIATISEAREDERGLWVKGQFHSTPDAQAARTIVRERLERGKSVGMSIGYRVNDDEFKEAVRYLKDVDLFEVSLVSVPANPEAQLAAVKSDTEPLPQDESLKARRTAMRRLALNNIKRAHSRRSRRN